ncbi:MULTISPECIES: succinate dehydrogenase, hydrophobic membrane anchor protein [Thiorhodovibrio]|uniref:succinate dehydrogenase, hydrophobic membrane anchor protein n=1 Tax=Thiorhodovibrio TaxID=61593 RepID=UPI0019140CB0|nr:MULTISPECIES: succinate dehydrogenase, hydrophobic membrane anchor protein [Thiorhodovibrio]MBK5968318.1 succinate dehydrogenase, hydrophobic membrane anchor protein [Thiorhodovibrio winogradskyi]WPL13233.1 Succinate dehydrogenase hydrophobic membrane anchor subunit [Thiorhodovibrio litoralis]
MSRQASGLKAWFIQRLSAVYIALFGSYLIIRIVLAPPPAYADFLAWLSTPPAALGILLYIPLLLAHAWVGLRDVLIDYIKPSSLRLGLLGFFAFVLLGSGLWAAQAVLLARALALGTGSSE